MHRLSRLDAQIYHGVVKTSSLATPNNFQDGAHGVIVSFL